LKRTPALLNLLKSSDDICLSLDLYLLPGYSPRSHTGELVVKKFGADVSARREEWESGWKEKYVVGEDAGALPSMLAYILPGYANAYD
jgi:hypothetical protein